MNEIVAPPTIFPRSHGGAYKALLSLAVFLIPFISWGNPPWLLGFFVLLVAVCFLVMVRDALVAGEVPVPAIPFRAPLVIVFVLSLIHLALSPVPYSSLLFLVQISVALAFYFLLVSKRPTPLPDTAVLTWTSVLVIWVAFQFMFKEVRPPSGPFSNPNYFATVLLTCLAYVLGSLMAGPVLKRKQLTMLSAAIACSGVLMMIGSRSAGIGMIILWVAYLVFSKGHFRWVVVLVILTLLLLPNMIRYRVTEGYKGDPHAFSRVRIWQAAVKMGADHPIIGVGPNLFYDYGPQYAFPTDELPVRYGRIVRKPHNEYLRSWAEGGVVGAFAMGLFLLIAGRLMLLAWRKGLRGPPLAFGVILFQGCFHDITEVFSIVALMAWWLAQIVPDEGRTLNVRRGTGRLFAVGAGVLILSFSLWLNLDLVSRALWMKGKGLINTDIQAALKATRTASLLDPLLPGAARDLGQVQLMLSVQAGGGRTELWDRARTAILRAQRLNRLDSVPLRLESSLYMNAARANGRMAGQHLAVAAGKLREAAELEPQNALILLNLSSVRWDQGQRDAALDLVEKALEMEPNYLQAHLVRISYLSQIRPEKLASSEKELKRARERAVNYRPNSSYEEIILR